MGKVLYKFAAFIFKLYFALVQRWKIKGKENTLHRGPLLVMANHISNMDPPLVGALLEHQVHFMAKEELFTNPIVSPLLKTVGAFPVKRGRPDMKAIRKAFNILKEEEILGIFPEGTRHRPGKMGKAKSGAVMIALKSKAPILPIGIKDIKNGKRLKVSVGEPFTLDQYYNKNLSKEEVKEVGEFIMGKIKMELDSLED